MKIGLCKSFTSSWCGSVCARATFFAHAPWEFTRHTDAGFSRIFLTHHCSARTPRALLPRFRGGSFVAPMPPPHAACAPEMAHVSRLLLRVEGLGVRSEGCGVRV